MAETRQHPTNGAIAVIDERLFEQLLDLPQEVSVRGVYLDPMRRAIILHLVGDSLPPLIEGQEAERVSIQVETVRDDDGKRRNYFRLQLAEVREVEAPAVEVGHGETPPEEALGKTYCSACARKTYTSFSTEGASCVICGCRK